MKYNSKNRLYIFSGVAAFHLILIFFLVWSVELAVQEALPIADVVKIVDIDEAPPPPPPPDTEVVQNLSETVAENFIETETIKNIVSALPTASTQVDEDYIPQSRISVPPRFNDKEIRDRLVYPSIAQRSGIEGRVILELFINRAGLVTRVNILKEEPLGRGFGEAALSAFTGLKARPAESNGEVVAVRFRYPVRFELK